MARKQKQNKKQKQKMVIFKSDPRYSKTRLRKPCRRCDKMFRPTTRFTTLCDNCLKKSAKKRTKDYLERTKAKKKQK